MPGPGKARAHDGARQNCGSANGGAQSAGFCALIAATEVNGPAPPARTPQIIITLMIMIVLMTLITMLLIILVTIMMMIRIRIIMMIMIMIL